jgi:hypothetical protein
LLTHYASELLPPRLASSASSASSSTRPSHAKARAAAALASSRLLADVPGLQHHRDFRRSDVLAKVASGARQRRKEEGAEFEWRGNRGEGGEMQRRMEGKENEK